MENQTGTVSGDTWTWPGEGHLGEKVFHTRYIMKVVSKDSYEYTDEWGEGEQPIKLGIERKVHSCRDHQARDIETGGVTAFHS